MAQARDTSAGTNLERPPSEPSIVDRWTADYAAGDTPYTMRTSPSGSVVWALAELRRRGARLRTAVDVGCGKGRNSLFLAAEGLRVTALDFTPHAIDALHVEAARRGLQDRIRAVVHDVTEPWPIPPDPVDLIVDAFCFKHIAPHELRQAYRDHVLRALALRGHYMIAFASIGDGYYGRYKVQEAPDGQEVLTLDPHSGIESVLYTRDRVAAFFAPELDVCGEMKHTKPSTMRGMACERETYALLLRRRPGRFVG